MPRVGWLGVVSVCALSIFSTAFFAACGGEPPDKELQQAQAAIEAARASGADRYAREEFAAAEQALVRGREAVEQRDYRLALNNALDSRERALAAARDAAEKKAQARSDAGKALAEAADLVATARGRLKTAEGAHVAGKTLAAVRRATADADAAVQEARTAFNAGDYQQVLEAVPASAANLLAALRSLDPSAPPPPRRRR